ncbi:MAG: group 1 truncated hemoglobin [Gammaproteobacteria bacterium]|nr:group 1 truncated hemoglobin [Gammaproteobacteria bacterium]
MRRVSTLCLVVALTGAACAHQPSADDLYRDLGETQGIAAIVDGFLLHLAGNDRIVDTFADTDIAEFRRLLIEQLCDLSGGPCEYSGRSMAEAHRDMDVSAMQFNALVEDFMKAMDDAGVPRGAQNRLLALLAPMHGEIVAP